MGPLLGAEFLAATGGDMAWFETPTGSPASPDSHPQHVTPDKSATTTTGPRRFHRRRQRVFYMSVLSSIRGCEKSRKRVEGKRHFQAVLDLARRRVNVLWTLLRDDRCYQATALSG